jgi:hypothetical protein
LTVSAGGITNTGASTFNGNITSTGSITISANGLTVSGGGATVTGGSTFNGNVTSTGTITSSGIGGLVVSGGPVSHYNRTSAQLKVSTPTAVGQEWYDTTLKQPVWSSGTATCYDYVTATGTIPSGYLP